MAEDPYVAIQGEGSLVGIPMLFVRFQGCPVGCTYCDSVFTWDMPRRRDNRFRQLTYDELYERYIRKTETRHIWFTGGEPMIYASALDKLIDYMVTLRSKKELYVCTSGAIWSDRVERVADRLTMVVVDIKLPSAKSLPTKKEAIEYGSLYGELKIVVDHTIDDVQYVERLIRTLHKTEEPRITLQPKYASEDEIRISGKAVTDTAWRMDEFATWVNEKFSQYPNVALGLQLHKVLYPTRQRGT